MLNAYSLSDWIDVSIPLRPGMPHWPGDFPFAISRDLEIEKGDACNLSRIQLSVHSGTHMDAPLHFLRDGRPMDALPFNAVVGRARIIEIEDTESIKADELDRHDIEAGERILFKTVNSTRAWKADEFYEDFVYISKEGAAYLAEKRVITVGVDYLSVGGFKKDAAETHYVLLGAGIWVIECLDLSACPSGHYDMICLPLRISGAEGSPARAILRKER
jgi:arylformamidase